MLPLRLAGFWAAIGWLGVGTALVLSLWPHGVPLPFHVWDKFQHVGGYFILTSWFLGICRRERYGRVALACFVLGVAIELLQGLTPTRSAELGDVFANSIGIAAALLLAWLGLGGWAARLERLAGLVPR
jgi:VanZ family protein